MVGNKRRRTHVQPARIGAGRPQPKLLKLRLLKQLWAALEVALHPVSAQRIASTARRRARDELAALCRKGVEEIVVLDGRGRKRECMLRDEVCPGLRIRFDQAQVAKEPVSVDFLLAFDAWIEEQDFKDPDTGQIFDREVLEAEMAKIEKPAGIANPKDFRNEVVKFALRHRAANDGDATDQAQGPSILSR